MRMQPIATAVAAFCTMVALLGCESLPTVAEPNGNLNNPSSLIAPVPPDSGFVTTNGTGFGGSGHRITPGCDGGEPVGPDGECIVDP
jgi:hypothetical protein